METLETIKIKKILLDSCFGSNPKLAKEYGTAEVTIDFQRNAKGKEIVDFMSYDAKNDIFRCYEIKISMADFKSNAKKSWYGNYNYLVISKGLYEKQPFSEWKNAIPKEVGIIVVNTDTGEKECLKRSIKKEVENKNALKNSLLRSMFYQNCNKEWRLRNGD